MPRGPPDGPPRRSGETSRSPTEADCFLAGPPTGSSTGGRGHHGLLALVLAAGHTRFAGCADHGAGDRLHDRLVEHARDDVVLGELVGRNHLRDPKALDTAPSGDPSESPTLTASATRMGVIMGTAAYMSPEQATGSPVDKRADIWSFGVVLFEMLTGQRMFTGETVSHVLASVLRADPDWTTLPSETPAAIHTLLRRCLAKDRRRRVPDIGMARIEIDDAITAPATDVTNAVAVAPVHVWQQPAAVAGVALGAAVLAGLVVWSLLGRVDRPVLSPKRLTVTLPGTEQLPSGVGEVLALSPGGQTLLYRAWDDDGAELLIRRSIDQFEATPMPTGSDGNQHRAFFSPDGQSVGYNANGMLNRIAVGGGPTQALRPRLPSYIRGADWGPDDTIVFGLAELSALMRVLADGGEPETLFASDDGRLSWYPEILADGNAILFTLTNAYALSPSTRLKY